MFPFVAIILKVTSTRVLSGDGVILRGDLDWDFSDGIEYYFNKALFEDKGVPIPEGPLAYVGLWDCVGLCEK